MEELIKGVEILKTNNYYRPTAFAIVVMIVAFLIFFVLAFMANEDSFAVLFGVFAIIIPIILLLLIVSHEITHPTWSRCYTTEYECYLHEDEISFKEFNENLEIIKQDGKIFIIKEKNK